MGLKTLNFDRDAEIFKDAIVLQSYSATAKKYRLSHSRVPQIFQRFLRGLHGFINSQKCPRPQSWEFLEMHKEKDYWFELVDKYVKWVNDRTHLTMASPIDHLRLIPSVCGMLFNFEIMTVGDLLEQLKNDKWRLLDYPGFGHGKLRILEDKLKEHGFDPKGGRDQQKGK